MIIEKYRVSQKKEKKNCNSNKGEITDKHTTLIFFQSRVICVKGCSHS